MIQVFLDCPQNADNRTSLVESIAVLISLSQSLPDVGLVNAAESCAAMILDINGLFQTISILHRVGVMSVFSHAADSKNRVFAQGMCTMGWGTRYSCLASPNGHLSLLCGQGKEAKTFREKFKTFASFHGE